MLFLLDELLSGTNSHDREHGAEAMVRGLLDRGAIGLVTTHDLALSAIADRLAPRAANVHFADVLDAGSWLSITGCGRSRADEQRAGADAGGRAGGVGVRPKCPIARPAS